jgi:beta-mannosidase
MGTLYWQLNDVWPVVSWSSVDVFGRWKPLHYRARELYGTFFAEARTEADTVRVRLVSDSRGAFSGRLVAEAFSVRHGRVRADTLAVRLAPGEARTYRLRLVDERGVTRLDTRSTLASPWDVALEDPGLRVERRGDRLVLTAARVALGVWLEDDANGVHLPINYLDLWPGVPVAVPVPAGVSVTIRSLYDARRR